MTRPVCNHLTPRKTMKTLTLTLLGVALGFAGMGCAAKGSIKTGQNAGANVAVHVGYNTGAPAAAQR